MKTSAAWLNNRLNPRRLLLRLALGTRAFAYMERSVLADRRCRTAKTVDIVIRKDGLEKRIEADWVKNIYKIIWTFEAARPAEEALSLSEGITGQWPLPSGPLRINPPFK